MKRSTEAPIVRACLELLHLKKIFAWRQNQGAIPLKGGGYRKFVGLKGVSDILALMPDGSGRLFAVEVKTASGKIREEQQQFLDRVNQLGGYAVVVRDVKELESILNDLGF